MNFFSRCRFKHICRKSGSKHPASKCSTNKSAVGKTPIKLDRIIYFTQNYPTFLFFQAGIYALFQTTLFALDYPVFQNIYQVNSNSIQKIIERFLLDRVAGPFSAFTLFQVASFSFRSCAKLKMAIFV